MKTPYAPDRLRSYWLAHKGLLIVMILSGFGCNMLNAAVVIEQGQMLDQLILTGPGMALLEAAGQFLLLVLVVQLLRAIKRWTTRRFASVTCAAMRSALLTAVLNGRIDTEAGDLLNRGMQDVELCTDGMRKLTTELFDTGVLMASTLIAMIRCDLRLTLLSVISIPLAMLTASLLKKRIVSMNARVRHQAGSLHSLTLEFCTHTALYRISGTDPINRRRYHLQLNRYQSLATLPTAGQSGWERSISAVCPMPKNAVCSA